MKKLTVIAAALLLGTASSAFGYGEGLKESAAGPISSSTIVTLDIPSVIAIDVESDVQFNFDTGYTAAPTPETCINAFPPGSNCVTYLLDPSSVSTTATITGNRPLRDGAAATNGVASPAAIYISIMDTDTASARKVTEQIEAAWTPNVALGPVPAWDPKAVIQTKASTTHNTLSMGNADWDFVDTSAKDISYDALESTSKFHDQLAFNWLRMDQALRLKIDLPTQVLNTVSIHAHLTYSHSRS